MVFRYVPSSVLLALALTACSGGEPSTEEATGKASAAAEMPASKAAATTTPAEATTTPAEATTTPAAAMAKTAEPASVTPPAAATTPTADPAKLSATPVPAAKTAAAPAAAEVVKVAAMAEPPASYARCAGCHTINKGGAHTLGPNLYGVFGKPAARGSYAFSEAYKNAGLVLDEPTLHKWLENPRALVPGNRMSFPGIKDAAKRQEIIDYLKKNS